MVQPTPRARRRPRVALWRLIRANLYDIGLLLRESWVVLSGAAVLVLLGTLYFHYLAADPLEFVPAVYETLKLLTFQSGLDLPADPLGRALFFLIPLLGLALIFQSVLNFGRLLLDKGGRREAWQIALASTYRDHIIICGFGRVSLRVLVQLIEAGYEAVVVEREWSREFVERALHLKTPVVLGDAREPETLGRAGIGRARALIVSTSDDLLNVEVALTARAVRPDIRVILRVFNEELDRNLERTFGPNSAFSASALAAPTFAAAAVSRAIDWVLPVGETLLGISQLAIQPNSQLSGFVRAIEESNDIRVLQHQDASGRRLRRDPLRPLGSGDRVTVLGPLAALEMLRIKNVRGSKLGFLSPLPLQHPTEQLNTVIICGLGKIGYRVVQLLRRLDPRLRIVVIRLGNARNEFFQRISRLDGIEIVIGDGRDADVLREAGIDTAYAVAALTADDGLNIQIGLSARRCRPDVHVVLRIFSDTLAEKLEDMFGIHTAYSTSALAGPTLAAAAALGDIMYAFDAGEQIFSTDEVDVQAGDAFAGRNIAAIQAQHDALVIGLRRGATALVLPQLDVLLAPGDQVTLLAPLGTLVRLRAAMRQSLAGGDGAVPEAEQAQAKALAAARRPRQKADPEEVSPRKVPK
jgi:Trk K+ transport system NAD-binding subunit